jgi:hypothetical protein
MTAITFGQTVTGSLSVLDGLSTLRPDARCDRYTFSATAGQLVAISMSSSDFDTYLFLIGPANAEIAHNDDDVITNSRIPRGTGLLLLPETGTYVIEATSFRANVTGNYVLTLEIE